MAPALPGVASLRRHRCISPWHVEVTSVCARWHIACVSGSAITRRGGSRKGRMFALSSCTSVKKLANLVTKERKIVQVTFGALGSTWSRVVSCAPATPLAVSVEEHVPCPVGPVQYPHRLGDGSNLEGRVSSHSRALRRPIPGVVLKAADRVGVSLGSFGPPFRLFTQKVKSSR